MTHSAQPEARAAAQGSQAPGRALQQSGPSASPDEPAGGAGPAGADGPADSGAGLAQWWRRLLAFGIDCLVLTIATGALWGRLIASFANRLARAQATVSSRAPGASGAVGRVYAHTLGPYLIVLGCTVVVAVVYYWLLTGYFGTTIGKRSLGSWVVRADDRSPVGLGAAFVRAVVFVLGGEVLPFFFVADNMWLLGDRRRQCLHDKAARTVVVLTAPARRAGR